MLINYFLLFRFSQATATTTFTKRTSLSRRSTPDMSASCRGSGMTTSPCEWSFWAVTSSVAPPNLLFSTSFPSLCFPPFPLNSLLSFSLLSHTCTALLSALEGSKHQSSTPRPKPWLAGGGSCCP